MKKLLIFDAYGTLISTGTGSIDSTKKILALQDKDIDPVSFYAKWKMYHRKHLNDSITNKFLVEWDIFVLDLECLYKDYQINRNAKEDVKLMLETQFNRKVFEDTVEVINKLKEKYRVVIGSTADTYPLLKNMEDNNLSVHKVYTSEIIKTYKPDKKFYKYILENEKIDASEAIFIGDSLLDDVYGPSQLNITTILIDRKNNIVINDIKPDYVIHSLAELLDISF